MIKKCPLVSTDKYKSLVKEIGEDYAFLAWSRNNEETPSVEEAKELLGSVYPVNNLEKKLTEGGYIHKYNNLYQFKKDFFPQATNLVDKLNRQSIEETGEPALQIVTAKTRGKYGRDIKYVKILEGAVPLIKLKTELKRTGVWEITRQELLRNGLPADDIHILAAAEVKNKEGIGKQGTISFLEDKIEDSLSIEEPDNNVNYKLKAVKILSTPKADEIFRKGDKNNWSLEKILDELQVPKLQQEIIQTLGTRSRVDIITSLAASYTFTVETKVAIDKGDSFTNENTVFYDRFSVDAFYNLYYINRNDEYVKVNDDGDEKIINKEEYDKKFEEKYPNTDKKLFKTEERPTQHYSNLTVPGGTNYQELRIITPDIIPSIKGHAQFAEANDIGWARVDDAVTKPEAKTDSRGRMKMAIKIEMLKAQGKNEEAAALAMLEDITDTKGTPTKTRRILEVQSDLFQKGRENQDLVTPERFDQELYRLSESNGVFIIYDTQGSPEDTFKDETTAVKRLEELNNPITEAKLLEKKGNVVSNSFLQLLNKDNNWVTFFIKSIIQDSAKRGYEKVLFPSGNTAMKVEGLTTVENYKKEKEDTLEGLKRQKT